jgi:hypothetical protein
MAKGKKNKAQEPPAMNSDLPKAPVAPPIMPPTPPTPPAPTPPALKLEPEIDAKKIAEESNPGEILSKVREWKATDDSGSMNFAYLYSKNGKLHVNGAYVAEVYTGADHVARYITDDGKQWKCIQ